MKSSVPGVSQSCVPGLLSVPHIPTCVCFSVLSPPQELPPIPYILVFQSSVHFKPRAPGASKFVRCLAFSVFLSASALYEVRTIFTQGWSYSSSNNWSDGFPEPPKKKIAPNLLQCNSGVDISQYLTLLTCRALEQTEAASAGHVTQWS